MKSIEIAYSLMDLFEKNNEKLYLVGGSVRDYLLFNSFDDFDFATTASPSKTMKILNIKSVDAYPLKYGTIKTNFLGQSIEITTLRKESEYINHRRPKEVEFIKDPEIDSLRRDLTINALYLDKNGILDFHHGLDDLNTKKLQFIGSPLDRIQEDSLRILRIIRFSLTLGFEIEKTTKKILKQYSFLLNSISKEKIKTEYDKMLKHVSSDTINKELAKYDIYLQI